MRNKTFDGEKFAKVLRLYIGAKSVSECSRLTGVSESWISKAINNNNPPGCVPTKKTLLKFCQMDSADPSVTPRDIMESAGYPELIPIVLSNTQQEECITKEEIYKTGTFDGEKFAKFLRLYIGARSVRECSELTGVCESWISKAINNNLQGCVPTKKTLLDLCQVFRHIFLRFF